MSFAKSIGTSEVGFCDGSYRVLVLVQQDEVAPRTGPFPESKVQVWGNPARDWAIMTFVALHSLDLSASVREYR